MFCKERHAMKPVIRSLIASLGTFAAFYYVYWVPVAIILEIAYGRFQVDVDHPGAWIIGRCRRGSAIHLAT